MNYRVLWGRARVIVRPIVSFDDDTLGGAASRNSEIVHGVTHHDFQRLTNHIRLNHVVSGFQRLNELEDNRFIGQMTFGGQNTAYCSRKNSGLFSKTIACMAEILRQRTV